MARRGRPGVKAGKKTVKPVIAIGLVLLLFFTPVFLNQSMDIYKLTPEKLCPGQTIKAGQVRGSMTILEGRERRTWS